VVYNVELSRAPTILRSGLLEADETTFLDILPNDKALARSLLRLQAISICNTTGNRRVSRSFGHGNVGVFVLDNDQVELVLHTRERGSVKER